MSVLVVCDSTADLEEDFLAEYGVSVVPLIVEMDGKSLKDREEIGAQEFLLALPHVQEMPHTAAPSPGAFRKVYQHHLDSGMSDILSIHLAGGLSSTVRSAEMAARMVSGRVAVVDGNSASLGTGLLVWWAAVRARQGASLETLVAEVEQLKEGLCVLAAPMTLEYLARGGRIGQAARLIGTLLDMKPILFVEKGSIRPERKVRGERQIIPAMLSAIASRVKPKTPILAALAHSGQPQRYGALKEALEAQYDLLGYLEGFIGPVISTHVGPGAFGVIVLPLTEEQHRLWEESIS